MRNRRHHLPTPPCWPNQCKNNNKNDSNVNRVVLPPRRCGIWNVCKKVYAHAVLTFPDGYKLMGKFPLFCILPSNNKKQKRTTIRNVKMAFWKECLAMSGNNTVEGDDKEAAVAAMQLFDLYVTPPRRLLEETKTLQEEGFVPAAKIFVSWNKNNMSQGGGSYLQQWLLDQTSSSTMSASESAAAVAALYYPTGQAVAAAKGNDYDNNKTMNHPKMPKQAFRGKIVKRPCCNA